MKPRVSFNSSDTEKPPIVKHTGLDTRDGARVSVKHAGYATLIYQFEWQITILFTSRQDGNTHWTVALTTIDGDTAIKQGLTSYRMSSDNVDADIMQAMFELTKDAGWIEPINQ